MINILLIKNRNELFCWLLFTLFFLSYLSKMKHKKINKIKMRTKKNQKYYLVYKYGF
jgi:hypothetical protein